MTLHSITTEQQITNKGKLPTRYCYTTSV